MRITIGIGTDFQNEDGLRFVVTKKSDEVGFWLATSLSAEIGEEPLKISGAKIKEFIEDEQVRKRELSERRSERFCC